MRRLEMSGVTSNLLLVSSVTLATAPLLLGDHLILVVTSLMKEGGVMVDQFSAFLIGVLS